MPRITMNDAFTRSPVIQGLSNDAHEKECMSKIYQIGKPIEPNDVTFFPVNTGQGNKV